MNGSSETEEAPSAAEAAIRLHQSGQLEAAERAYRALLAREPSDEGACLGLSLLLLQTGRAEDAVAFSHEALRMRPADAGLLNNLGEALRTLGRLGQAATVLRQAVAACSELPAVFLNLASVLDALGERGEALAHLTTAVSLAPESGAAQRRLADALWAAGQQARALGHYHAALAAEPASAPLLVRVAHAQHSLGLYDGAVALCDRALEQAPAHVEATTLRARALLRRGQLGPAADAFRAALMLDPDHPDALFGYTSAAFRTGRVEDAMASARRLLARDPDAALHSNLVFLAAFSPAASAADIHDEARSWARLWADPLAQPVRFARPRGAKSRRLKIGYVSPNFFDHCQAFFMAPVLAHHDRTRFEVACYASVRRPDHVTELLRGRAEHWHDVSGLDDAALTERIRADGVDVLVDLTMHMADDRLGVFARRAAPVQISWLAYPGTTGLSQIDYRITDRFLDPPALGDGASAGDAPHIARMADYAERSIVLPDTFWCYDPLTTEPEVGPLPAEATGVLTFGSLNNAGKLNAGVIALWSTVLRSVPQSRLLVRVPEGSPRQRVTDEFAAHGVPAERLLFVGQQSRAAYLRTYQRIDIGLDTQPYNGHTTSLDATWMGVPVVTLVGATVVGRAGLSQAQNLGLPELIAHDRAEFVEKAARLAGDLPALAALRSALRARMERSPLMDGARFTRALERAYTAAQRASAGALS